MASQSGTEFKKKIKKKKQKEEVHLIVHVSGGFICTRYCSCAKAYYCLLVEPHGHLPVKSVLAGIVELGNW